MMVTTTLFVVIVALFLWMVRSVIIASILGVIVASYTRPIYLWLLGRIHNGIAAATMTLMLLIGPAVGLTIYSGASYLSGAMPALRAEASRR